ncbi:uncharacterized protein LOC141908254 [Tubulanus polymorphus]|uniref:uncharacterized protein LOC141908254 n=1 Tax=Tubulanus polymorphus TaxID=672921 RepID=UPI003DA5B527
MTDPNFVNMFAEKALEASKNGDYALLGSLKSGNCLREDYVDQSGATCVHYAARVGKIDVLQYLIEDCEFSGARRSLIGATPAHDASATGQLNALQWLLQYTVCSIEDRDETGATCLHLAARFGHLNIVKWLTNEAGVNVMDKTSTGAIPLHFAAAKGDLESVKVLIQKSPRSVDVQMKNGVTVCYLACQEGHLDVVKYLVLETGASENIKAFDGMCCVHAAAQAGHLTVLEWLVVERRCNANDCDVDGSSTVHFAASKGHTEVLKWLLSRGVPFVRDKIGGTALHDGAESGQTECVKVLLDYGCDPSIADSKGLTAIELADKCNQKECVDLIRGWEQRKAPPRNGYVRIPDPPMTRAPQPPSYNSIDRRGLRPSPQSNHFNGNYPSTGNAIINHGGPRSTLNDKNHQFIVHPDVHYNNVVNVERSPGWETILPKDESSTDPSSRSSTLRTRTNNNITNNGEFHSSNDDAKPVPLKRLNPTTTHYNGDASDETDSTSSKSSTLFEAMIQKQQRKILRSPTPESNENNTPRVVIHQHSPTSAPAPPPPPPPPPVPPPISESRGSSPVSRSSSSVSSNSSHNGQIQRPGSPSLIQRRSVAQARSMFQQKGGAGDIIAELKNRNIAASLRKTSQLNDAGGAVIFSSSKKISSPTSTIPPRHENLSSPRTVATPPVKPKAEQPSVQVNGDSDNNGAALNFSPENFMDDVPKMDKSGREVPQWRRLMLARQLAERAKTDHDIKQKKQKEEERLSKLPPWKREMIQRKEMTIGGPVDKSDIQSDASDSSTLSSPEKPIAVVPPKPNPKPNPKPKISSSDDDHKLSPWQQELQNRKMRVQ